MITINVKASSNLLQTSKAKLAAINNAIHEAGLYIEGEVKESIAGNRDEDRSVDTGRFLQSVRTDNGTPLTSQVESDVEYACLVGANQAVYCPEKKSSGRISKYKYDTVLSKDGKSHKVLKRNEKYNDNKDWVSCIKIKINNHIKPLLVTENHLLLCIRKGELIWLSAKELSMEDYVFRKRNHAFGKENVEKIMMICKCGKEYKRIKSYLRNKPNTTFYCSKKCRHTFGKHDFAKGKRWKLTEIQKEKHRGKNNKQWKGGIGRLPYDWRFNKNLKEIVKRRDNYKCQICGKTKQEVLLVVHHKDFDKMNSDIKNLITLCRYCHGRMKRIDCSLPEIELKVFKPIQPQQITSVILRRKKQTRLPKLYDLTIEEEDSYVAGGILVHNSFLEYGTIKFKVPRRHFQNTQQREESKIVEFVAKAAKS